MDKIKKTLQKLSVKERGVIKSILLKLQENNFQGLDLVKLKGNLNIFRVRQGKLRIIFFKKEKEIRILAIERSSEKSYWNF